MNSSRTSFFKKQGMISTKFKIRVTSGEKQMNKREERRNTQRDPGHW